MACSDTPKIFFVTYAFLCIGGLFLLIGFATPQWLVLGNLNTGLWQVCASSYGSLKTCVPLPSELIDEWLVAIRALTCIALLFVTGSGVIGLAFIPMKTRQKTLANLIAIGCLLSSICIGIPVGRYVLSYAQYSSLSQYNSSGLVASFGYSFILSAAATASLVVASILAFVLACNIRPENALPTQGVVYYNHQGTPRNSQDTGIQQSQVRHNPYTVTGQYGHQSDVEPYYPRAQYFGPTVPGQYGQKYEAPGRPGRWM